MTIRKLLAYLQMIDYHLTICFYVLTTTLSNEQSDRLPSDEKPGLLFVFDF
ncbi:hypothetical protein SAMN05444506_107208 [Pseudomonas syringae]|nr:hypothetical protein SAMN05444506_107208 [Pseudomonas syringae]